MRVVSFNVNGLRSRLHQLAALVEQQQPDIIGLQETKVVDEQFPLSALEELGYHVSYHGQKGHYGVALMSRQPHRLVTKGFPGEPADAQRRLIAIEVESEFGPITVINGYFPQGDNRNHPDKFPAKRAFYANLSRYLEESFQPNQAVMVMGDFNISYQDSDIGIGPDNAKRWLKSGKCSFLPEEREWLQKLLGWGLFDSFRLCHPEENNRFSWFDYRSRGFERDPKRGLRIDTILVSEPLTKFTQQADIDYDIRAIEKPSDHAPVWLQLGQ